MLSKVDPISPTKYLIENKKGSVEGLKHISCVQFWKWAQSWSFFSASHDSGSYWSVMYRRWNRPKAKIWSDLDPGLPLWQTPSYKPPIWSHPQTREMHFMVWCSFVLWNRNQLPGSIQRWNKDWCRSILLSHYIYITFLIWQRPHCAKLPQKIFYWFSVLRCVRL